MARLFDSVRYLKGVGDARAKTFANLGISTLYDLISYFPRAYEDRSRVLLISELQVDEPACFRAFVTSQPRTHHIRKGLDLTKLTVADETARLNLTFFNQTYVADNLHYGEEYYFYGTVNGDYMGYQITNPVFEPADAPGVLTRRIMPVYPLTAGLHNNLISRTVALALDACLDEMPELLPEPLRMRFGLCDAVTAYRNIHTPASEEALAEARHRLIFEEFFIYSVGLSLLRARRSGKRRSPFEIPDMADFEQALPFALTGAQKRAVADIAGDLGAGRVMNRMVQGDVGSGKTVVAAAAAWIAAKNGQQAALMAPTEILAEQHARGLEPLLEKLGVRVTLLTGSMTPAQKKVVRAAIAAHETDLIVGTHALISEATSFSDLGLVIADEQHRFGVSQRAALAEKGDDPHLLVMSATPIPRTLALILYGDLDLSVIDELPPGRQSIDTFLVGEDKRARLNAFVRKQVAEGHQVYIVCPAIEEGEDDSLRSAELWAETLQMAVFPELRVGLLHGKMKGVQKEQTMAAFARGEYDILVATTVIEVGVDVPNATLIIIENADRFGLSQLHQLRGRVGRGADKSCCVLVSSNRNQETMKRLKALCKTNDGFEIAREDLALRGPGDFFGTRQHGLPAFKVGSLELDLKTLQDAQTAAAEFSVSEDLPAREEYRPLMERINALFSENS
ncbi:MAG: ATP-dependent DNA helicase RecG [Oscillospiraceae bacterium]|nr:ATP-dependent DNA helicase RecG [Oscillospiraceae bacterium]